MKPRVLRLLDAGRAPARWLREAGRAAARTQAVERGAAWVDAAAAPHPALREGPLWGHALGTVLSGITSIPAGVDETAPAASPRGIGAASMDAPPRPARPSAARERRPAERRAPPPSRRRAAASADSAAAPRVARASALPRRADAARLAAWSAAAHPRAAGSGTSLGTARGFGAEGGTRRVVVDAMPGERRVWTPSPHALPILAARDRLRGDVARRAASRHVADPAWEGREPVWIERVASAVARRIPRGASGVPAAREAEGSAEAWDAEGEPHRPLLARGTRSVGAERIAPLVADWASPVDGPAAPREVLDRLARAARPCSARPSAERRPRLAPAAADLPHPPARSAPSPVATDGERRFTPADHPLFRRPRLAAQVDAGDADSVHRTASTATPFHRPRRASASDERRAEAGSRARAAHPWFASRAPSAAGGTDGDAIEGGRRVASEGAEFGEASAEDTRDRWRGWPVVLPWPAPATRSGGAGERSARVTRPFSASAGSRTAQDTAGAADSGAGDGAAPRAAQPARADASAPPVPNTVPSPSTFARAAVRQPPSVVREMAADGARPDGWLIDAVRSLAPPIPGSDGPVVVPGAADLPGPPVAVTSPEGVGQLGTGALPLPWFVGGEAEGDPGGGLDALAGRIRRILDDEARRHGIDV